MCDETDDETIVDETIVDDAESMDEEEEGTLHFYDERGNQSPIHRFILQAYQSSMKRTTMSQIQMTSFHQNINMLSTQMLLSGYGQNPCKDI